jgi:NADH-quinone oxidoreductase subunit G
MPTVYVNDKPVEIGTERLNCVQAAEKAGVVIPHYCWHPSLSIVASCRMCLVEVGDRKPDGTIAMQPKVLPGCQTPVKDGTVIVTGDYDKRDKSVEQLPYPADYTKTLKLGERAKKSQADTLEGLLLNHPLDCPVCDKAGECKLQDYSYQYGRSESRLMDEKNTPPNKPGLSEKITLFTDRCIMCSRCVRFTREIAGTAELQIVSRGSHAEIDTFPGKPLANKLSGNVVDLCPVGALGSKDFLYKQRVWYLKTTDSVCTGCSTGCSIHVDTNKDIVYRLRPRFNPLAQGHFMCDEGRWGYHFANSKERLTKAYVRQENGQAKAESAFKVLKELDSSFRSITATNAAAVIAILSPNFTVEEAYLAAKYFKSLSADVQIALGYVPVVGQDDHYPKDRRGNELPADKAKFTIHAEKVPNRRGVEAILTHFQKEIIPFDAVVDRCRSKKVDAIFLSAGYASSSIIPSFDLDRLDDVKLFATMDLFGGAATKLAKYVLPATTFAEKEGTFVNFAGLAQHVSRAVNSPGEIRSTLQNFSDLLGRTGLVQLATVRKELAEEVPYFAPLSQPLGSQGIRLG